MAYSNAIFYLDYVNGSNANRTALTSVSITNNNGIIRCTKNSHGLVTGAVVTGSGFSQSAYNTTHIVNYVDANTFDLLSSRATGTLTVIGTPSVDETLQVGTQVFTFKNNRTTSGQITISSSPEQLARNICYALMSDISTQVVAFVGTRAQPTNMYTVTVDNYLAGTIGNSTVLISNTSAIIASGSGVLSGGAQIDFVANDSGTITPFGGSSWSDAWQDITSGATAARIAPSDVIFIAKSSDPVGIGQAAFTNTSKTVLIQQLTNCSFTNNGSGGVLVTKSNHNLYNGAVVTVSETTDYDGDWVIATVDASSFNLTGASYVNDRTGTVIPKFTLTIDLCETAWTAANSATVNRIATSSDGKEGSYCMQIIPPASPTTNKLYAYYTISELDCSKYQKLSFWFKNEVAILSGNWKLCLCSDTAGATPVDSFLIPAIGSTTRWLPLTLTRSGGGNCGNSIKSIALYSDSVAPTGSKYVMLDNIICCTSTGLNLQSLISKNSQGFSNNDAEMWYCLQSINETTLLIDNDTGCLAGAGKGYTGTTETVNCYMRETIKTTLAATSTTIVQELQDSGLDNNGIVLIGGFNTTSSIMDGETYFDGLNGFGYGIYTNNKMVFAILNLYFIRYNYGVFLNHGGSYTILNSTFYGGAGHCTTYCGYMVTEVNCICLLLKMWNGSITTSYSNLYISGRMSLYKNIYSYGNGASGILFASSANRNLLYNVIIRNNVNGINFNSCCLNKIYNLTTANNSSGSILPGNGVNYIQNASLGETTKVLYINYPGTNTFVYIDRYDDNPYDNRGYGDGGYHILQNSIKYSDSNYAVQIFILSTSRNAYYKYPVKLMTIYNVTPNKKITCTVYVKKSSGTGIEACLYCQGLQIAGITNDIISDYVGNTTDWTQLTLEITPTTIGAIEIYGMVWWVSGAANNNVVFDSLTCTQET